MSTTVPVRKVQDILVVITRPRKMKTTRPNRYGYTVSYTRRKHDPSGIIIAWLGDDRKIHTKSIHKGSMRNSMWHAINEARTELLLKQMDCMCVGGYKKPMPMITTGLTREEARQAFLKEIQGLISPIQSPLKFLL